MSKMSRNGLKGLVALAYLCSGCSIIFDAEADPADASRPLDAAGEVTYDAAPDAMAVATLDAAPAVYSLLAVNNSNYGLTVEEVDTTPVPCSPNQTCEYSYQTATTVRVRALEVPIGSTIAFTCTGCAIISTGMNQVQVMVSGVSTLDVIEQAGS